MPWEYISQIPMQNYYFFSKITDTILAFIDTRYISAAIIQEKEPHCSGSFDSTLCFSGQLLSGQLHQVYYNARRP